MHFQGEREAAAEEIEKVINEEKRKAKEMLEEQQVGVVFSVCLLLSGEVTQNPSVKRDWIHCILGPLAQSVKPLTCDRMVLGLIRGSGLSPWARHFIHIVHSGRHRCFVYMALNLKAEYHTYK